MNHKTIAAFDFDGTITSKDTLFDFIRFYFGKAQLIKGLFWLSPTLILFKLGIIRNDIAKQKLFSFFFKGKSLAEFNRMGEKYTLEIDKITRETTLEKIKWHQQQNHTVVIISASIENWIQPWASQMGIEMVLATQIETENGFIKGSFRSKNCHGKEKVNRLLAQFPQRGEYTLYAYGDSSGDKELLDFSDHSCLVSS